MAHRLRVERGDDLNEYLIEIAKTANRRNPPWISRQVKWMTCWLISYYPGITPAALSAPDRADYGTGGNLWSG